VSLMTCASRSRRGRVEHHVTSRTSAHVSRSGEQGEHLQRNTSSDLLTPAHACSRFGASDLLSAHTPLGVSSKSCAHPRRSFISSRSISHRERIRPEEILDAA
jgi:hypothetical protein